MILVLLLLALPLIGICAYLILNYRQIRLACSLPGPKAYPIIGNLHIFWSNTAIQEMTGSYEKYGALARCWFSVNPIFVIMRPDDIQTILSSRIHIDKSPVYNTMRSYMGNSIVLVNGDAWHSKRKLLNPFFHLHVMEKLFGYMSEGGRQLCDLLERDEGKGINITSYLNNCVDKVLNCAILGVSMEENRSHEVEVFRKRRNMMYSRLNKPWLTMDWIFNLTGAAATEKKQKSEFHDLIKTNVDLRKKEMATGSVERNCLLDQLINISESNENFTLEDIVTEAFTLLITASDTTSAALVYSIYLLAKHPEALQKCYDEQMEIFSDSHEEITLNDLRRMKYLEQCISETLRIYPVLPMIARRLKEDVQVGEFVIPKESEVLIPVYELHRHHDVFPEPEKFDPERFSPENCAQRHAYSYIPFSAGVRNCIGQKFAVFQMKTILSHLIRRFKFDLVAGKEELAPRFRILLYAHGGVWITFNKRVAEGK